MTHHMKIHPSGEEEIVRLLLMKPGRRSCLGTWARGGGGGEDTGNVKQLLHLICAMLYAVGRTVNQLMLAPGTFGSGCPK